MASLALAAWLLAVSHSPDSLSHYPPWVLPVICVAVTGAEESLSLEDEKVFLQRQLDALKLQLGQRANKTYHSAAQIQQDEQDGWNQTAHSFSLCLCGVMEWSQRGRV